MAKMVCVACHVELRPEKNGTIVIEMASFGPYKIWDADTWKCPKCGIEIVAGFGKVPIREDHYAPDFPAWLERLKSKAERIEYANQE